MDERSNPLFGPNRLKLALFGLNLAGGCGVTTLPTRQPLTWAAAQDAARLADRAGIEALIPVAKWNGYGGQQVNGTSFDTYAWAAGTAAVTERAAVLATSHTAIVHPVMAAKQAATIDHISDGRFALNIVCGWSASEFGMFGVDVLPHAERYDHATEWIELLRALWERDEPFDFDGRYLHSTAADSLPKPVQQPFPPIMNAGQSDTGQRWAAKHADLVFTAIYGSNDFAEDARQRVQHLRGLAADHEREIQIWMGTYVVCRDTEAEALAYVERYAGEFGDRVAADAALAGLGHDAGRSAEDVELLRRQFLAGRGGFPLVGTPDQIVERLQVLADAGIDGVTLSWPLGYSEEVVQLERELLPRLVAAGLREPVA